MQERGLKRRRSKVAHLAKPGDRAANHKISGSDAVFGTTALAIFTCTSRSVPEIKCGQEKANAGNHGLVMRGTSIDLSRRLAGSPRDGL